MEKKRTAPDAINAVQTGACGTAYGTGANVVNLPRIQRKVYDILMSGGKYSVFDITVRLHLADPRGHIAALRRKGIAVLDEWRGAETRYKVYFINGGQKE